MSAENNIRSSYGRNNENIIGIDFMSNNIDNIEANSTSSRNNNSINRTNNNDNDSFTDYKNCFYKLGGCSDDIVGRFILQYLSSKDVARFASCSKYCLSIANQSGVWQSLIKTDFWGGPQLVSASFTAGGGSSATNYSFLGGSVSYWNSGPDRVPSNVDARTYQKLYSNMKQRVKDLQENIKSKQALDKLEDEVFYWTNILDIIQVKILLPLIFSSIFASILLFCLKYDRRLQVSTWVCASPIFFLISFIYFNVMLLVIVDFKRAWESAEIRFDNNGNNNSQFWSRVWKQASGPFFVIMNKDGDDGKVVIYSFLLFITLIVTQLILLCWKLSINYNTTSAFHTHSDSDSTISWGVVLIPIWLQFTIFCACPWACANIYDRGTFIISTIILWIPLFIFFVGVTVKLDVRESHEGRGHDDGKLGLVYFLIPFWILEGGLLLASLVMLIIGIWRFRQGLSASIKDQLFFFIISWLGLAPLVAFEALLCARDSGLMADYDNNSPEKVTTVETFQPILIVLALLSIIVCALLWFCFRTKNQIDYVSYYERSMGSKPIYIV